MVGPIEWRAPGLDATHPHLKEFLAFLPDFNQESDRGTALIGTSFVDELLLRTLDAFLIEGKPSKALLEGFNAPLGSLATRASAAYALALISDAEFAEIERLRKIRNIFAHQVRAAFAEPRISDICRELTYAVKDTQESKFDARAKFSSAMVSLILNLNNRPAYVSKHRRKWTSWPY